MPRRTRASIALPIAAETVLRELGVQIKGARRSRGISVRDAANRMLVSPWTLNRLEKGEPSVGIGVFVAALWMLGLHRRLETLIAPETDGVGIREAQRQLPKRIRKKKTDDFDF